MRRQTNPAAKFQAATYLLAGLLAVTNAAWFYSWRVRAVEHADALMIAKRPADPVVVYQYADPQPQQVQQAPTLADDERCMGGQVLRRIPNGWAGTGRRC